MGVDYTLSETTMESSSGNPLSFGVSLPILSCTMVIGRPLLPCPLLGTGKGHRYLHGVQGVESRGFEN